MTQPSPLEKEVVKPFCEVVDAQTGYPSHTLVVAPNADGLNRICCDARRTDGKGGSVCPYYKEVDHRCYCTYTPPVSK